MHTAATGRPEIARRSLSRGQGLGEVMVEMGIIDPLQLQSALGHQRQWGTPLGKALVELRFCTEDQLLAALSKHAGLETVALDPAKLDRGAASLLPQKVAERHRVVPLRAEGARGEILVVALGAAMDLEDLDLLRAASGKSRVKPLLAKDSEVERALGILYRGEEISSVPPPRPSAPARVEGELELDLGDAPPSSAAATSASLDDLLGAAPQPQPAPAAPRVLIYGWPAQAAELLRATLASQAIPSTIVDPGVPPDARQGDVMVAPLPAVEALGGAGAPPGVSIIVAVKTPEADLLRAQRVGARGYLATPVDSELLLRAVRRCRKAA